MFADMAGDKSADIYIWDIYMYIYICIYCLYIHAYNMYGSSKVGRMDSRADGGAGGRSGGQSDGRADGGTDGRSDSRSDRAH